MISIQVTTALLSIFAHCQAFFDYTCCDESCKEKLLSCIISEQTRKFFVCHCLEPNKKPLGGEAIWNDYSHRNDSTTTTIAPPTTSWPSTTMKPDPHVPKRITLWINLGVLSLGTTLTIITSVVVKKYLRRRTYEPLSRSLDSPYSETVEEIDRST